MEKSIKLTIFYCYSVCLVALIGLLISAPTFLKSWYDLKDPVNTVRNSEDLELSSFENFQAGLRRKHKAREYYQLTKEDGGWKMYQAAYNSRIASIRHQARRNEIASGLVAGLCILLFLSHILWVRRIRY